MIMITRILRDPPLPEPIKYPWLGYIPENGLVVLFHERRHGVCLMSGSNKGNKVGQYSTSWSQELFNRYPHELRLANP
jgi:hypothetical protein